MIFVYSKYFPFDISIPFCKIVTWQIATIFSVQVFSLTKRCTATLSISFRRATPILCGSIPFFPLKCMCVEKSVHKCTFVVITLRNVRKTYYFSREVTIHATIFQSRFSRSSMKLHRSEKYIKIQKVLSIVVAFPFLA